MDWLDDYIANQIKWSAATFGKGQRTAGITKHIRKELDEIVNAPADLMEWIDVVILAFDGAWRSGHTPAEIVTALQQKQAINFARSWPASSDPNEPTEHHRT
jgi:hypothetical protein